jgi:hypothetical protein
MGKSKAMMNRRHFAISLAGFTLAAGPALAEDDFALALQDRLEKQGFEIEAVGRTWLGRVRILARDSRGEREIVLNPRTGEILRDVWLTGDRSGHGGDAGSVEDDPKEEHDDDHSGSGGGGSGGNSGGGGGSGSGSGDDGDDHD